MLAEQGTCETHCPRIIAVWHLTGIQRTEDAEFCRQKQQVFVHVVLNNSPANVIGGQVAADELPRAASVSTLHHVRFVIARFMIIDARVNRIGIVKVGFDIVDEEVFRHSENLVDLPPVFATVF